MVIAGERFGERGETIERPAACREGSAGLEDGVGTVWLDATRGEQGFDTSERIRLRVNARGGNGAAWQTDPPELGEAMLGGVNAAIAEKFLRTRDEHVGERGELAALPGDADRGERGRGEQGAPWTAVLIEDHREMAEGQAERRTGEIAHGENSGDGRIAFEHGRKSGLDGDDDAQIGTPGVERFDGRDGQNDVAQRAQAQKQNFRTGSEA